MSTLGIILVVAGVMLGIGLLAVVAWLVSTSWLNLVERRLARRKGIYRELVTSLATRERALLEPEIHRRGTLLDLEALEAVLEEQARAIADRPARLLDAYDRLGLVDKYVERLRPRYGPRRTSAGSSREPPPRFRRASIAGPGPTRSSRWRIWEPSAKRPEPRRRRTGAWPRH